MKTLYITDLDGTFLTDEARVSPASARLVTELSHAGALISVATARTPATVEPIMADTYTAADMVVMTGAGLWNRPRHAFDSLRLLPPHEVAAITEAMRTGGISLFGYAAHPADGHLHVYHPAPALSEAERIFVGLRRNLALKTFHLAQSIPEADYDRTVLFFGMGSEARITAFAEELRRLTSCYVSYYKDTYLPDNWLIEIFAHGVSKAAGISQLKQHLQADRIVAFGDNLNDIPMLRSADLAVAVGNALPETKEAADIVIGDNNSDSVARFIADDYARTL